MFNFTYKEISKYIRKKDIDTVLSFSYSGFFKKLGVFILMLGFIIAIYAIGIGPTQGDYGNSGNRIASIMGNVIGPIVKISDLALFLIVFLWVIIPQYNRGVASVHGAFDRLHLDLSNHYCCRITYNDTACCGSRMDFVLHSAFYNVHIFLCICILLVHENTR